MVQSQSHLCFYIDTNTLLFLSSAWCRVIFADLSLPLSLSLSRTHAMFSSAVFLKLLAMLRGNVIRLIQNEWKGIFRNSPPHLVTAKTDISLPLAPPFLYHLGKLSAFHQSYYLSTKRVWSGFDVKLRAPCIIKWIISVCLSDFCQVELRLLAHFSSDPELFRIFNHPQSDVFTMLASQWSVPHTHKHWNTLALWSSFKGKCWFTTEESHPLSSHLILLAPSVQALICCCHGYHTGCHSCSYFFHENPRSFVTLL